MGVRCPVKPRPVLATAMLVGAIAILAAGCSGSPAPSRSAPAATGTLPAQTSGAGDVPRAGEAWIATQWVKDGGSTIRLVRLDGSGDHALPLDLPGSQTHPAWSPDGTVLLFVHEDADGRKSIWSAQPDGTGLKQLITCDLPCNQVDAPQWLASDPGGIWLGADADVTPAGPPGTFMLSRFDLAAGTLEPKFTRHGSTSMDNPRFSPDGRHAVYEGDANPAGTTSEGTVPATALYVVDLVAGSETRITDPGLYATQPDWLSNDTIVFNTCGLSYDACPTGAMNAYVVGFDGQGLRQLTKYTDAHTGVSQIRVTPDGTGFVVVRVDDRAGVRQIALMSLDGSSVVPIGTPPVLGTHPVLRPG